MNSIEDILAQKERNPAGIRFSDLCRLCAHFFGKLRHQGTSHCVYRTPWQGDPRVNIQNKKGRARTYQVRQVLNAVRRLKEEHDTEK